MRKNHVVVLSVLAINAVGLLCQPVIAGVQSQGRVSLAAANGKHEGQLGKLAEQLNLTQDQKDQIKPILKSHREQAKAVRHDTTLSKADKRAKLKAIRDDMWAQINPILTPAQQAQLQQILQARRANHKGHKNG